MHLDAQSGRSATSEEVYPSDFLVQNTLKFYQDSSQHFLCDGLGPNGHFEGYFERANFPLTATAEVSFTWWVVLFLAACFNFSFSLDFV